MGYTLTIGELKTEIYDEGLESHFHLTAESKNLPEAPAYGEPTDHSNSRWPSYTSWANAMRFVGLYDFMYNKSTGLLRQHPGCVPLVKEHKEIIDQAHAEFYQKYPNAKAGYSPKMQDIFADEDPDWPMENNMATRLEWLKFWVDWALANCKQPVFYNS
jgi:hypothetical protein